MLQLPLEELLEAGLFALNSELGRRVYGEEIMMGASVDDAFGRRSIDDYERIFDEGSPEQKLWAAINSDLSEEQQYVMEGRVPFFTRESREHNGFILDYHVYPEEELGNYEKNADEIIREYKITSEIVYISKSLKDDESLFIGRISIQDGKIDTGLDEEDLELAFKGKNKLHKYTRRKNIELLSGQDYDPMQVYKSLMFFIK